MSLSIQKYSSNVIELCITKTNQAYKQKFINKICETDTILELMKNRYGNFVLDKALQNSSHEYLSKLQKMIKGNLKNLSNVKLRNKFKQMIDKNL